MNREEVFERLNVIFRNNFDDDSIILTDDTTSSDIEDWDSMEQVNLIVTIQDEFKIKFNIEEVNSMQNVGEIVDSIVKKTGTQA